MTYYYVVEVPLAGVYSTADEWSYHNGSADDRMLSCQVDQFVGDVDRRFTISTSSHVTQISYMSEM